MKELEVTYLGKPINVGLLERIKAYSPMFDKTFDVMTTQEQKEQLDRWIEDGRLPNDIENLVYHKPKTKEHREYDFKNFVKGRKK